MAGQSVHESGQAVANGSSEADKRPVASCGASPGKSPVHMEAARALAKVLHDRGYRLVYGGGTVGIMGEVAKTLVTLSGPDAVHGVIPQALVRFERDWGQEVKQAATAKEVDERRFGRVTTVPDMHTRKHLMAQEVINGGPGSGFIAMSGGYGTLEELAEITTWNQLGIHSKGVVVYNIDGYYDGLMQWVHNAVDAGFIAAGNQNIMVEAKTPEQAIDALAGYKVSSGVFKLNWEER